MDAEKLLKTWLFKYSCQKKYTSALHGHYHITVADAVAIVEESMSKGSLQGHCSVISRNNGWKKILEWQALCLLSEEFSHSPSSSGLLHIRLALSNLHTITLDQVDSAAFHDAVSIVKDLYEEYQHIITYKEFAKVVTGLKTLAFFHILKENPKLAMPRLNLYYPRSGIQHPALDRKLAARLTKAQKDIRKFFLSLIANKKFQDKYFARDYELEFGADFQARLRKLTADFLNKIEASLPETEIQQLVSCGCGGDLCQKLSALRHPYIELFLDVLYGGDKDVLTEAAVLDFLNSLTKLKTGELSEGIGRHMLSTMEDSDGSQENQSLSPSDPATTTEPKTTTNSKHQATKQGNSNPNETQNQPQNAAAKKASPFVNIISDPKRRTKASRDIKSVKQSGDSDVRTLYPNMKQCRTETKHKNSNQLDGPATKKFKNSNTPSRETDSTKALATSNNQIANSNALQYESSQGFELHEGIDDPDTVKKDTKLWPNTYATGRAYKMKRNTGMEVRNKEDEIEQSPNESNVIVISSGSISKGSSEESASLLAGTKRMVDLSQDMSDKANPSEENNYEQVAIVSSSSRENSQSQHHVQKKRPLSEIQDNTPPLPDSPSDRIVPPSDSEDTDIDSDGRNRSVHKSSPSLPRIEKHLTPSRLCAVKLHRDKALDKQADVPNPSSRKRHLIFS